MGKRNECLQKFISGIKNKEKEVREDIANTTKFYLQKLRLLVMM